MSFSSSDFFAAAMKRRTPTGSVPKGFSQKTCFLGVDGGLEVQRPVAGRRGEHDDVDVRGDDLLVGVEADEAMLGIHLNTAGDLFVALQFGERRGEVVVKDIAHRDEVHVLGAGDHIDDGLGAAATAANDARFQFFLPRSANEFGTEQRKCGRAETGGGRFAEEGTAGDRVLWGFHDVQVYHVAGPAW